MMLKQDTRDNVDIVTNNAPSSSNPNVRTRDLSTSVMMDADFIDRIPWTDNPRLPGVSVKYLMMDLNSGVSVSKIRIKKGAHLPLHVHYSTATMFCTRGTFTYEAGTIGAGGFGYEPYGVIHEPEVPADDITELFVITTANSLIQLYNDDGSLGEAFHTRDTLKSIYNANGDAAVQHLRLPDWFWKD